jgi:hypothetical protein
MIRELFTIVPAFDGRFVVPPPGSARVLDALLFEPQRPVGPDVLAGLTWMAPDEHPLDFVSSLDRARLVSQRVKDLVSELDAGEVSWLPADVGTPSSRTLQYWLVHYPRPREVLDLEATTFGPSGKPIRWVIDLEQVQDLPVFMVTGPLAETFLVHPEVKDALVASGVTGMDVRRTRT